MVAVNTFAWLFFVAFSLVLFGKFFRDYTVGILGSLFLFLFGLYVWMSPVVGLESWLNVVLGSVLFGVGAYMWVWGSVEVVDGGYS